MVEYGYYPIKENPFFQSSCKVSNFCNNVERLNAKLYFFTEKQRSDSKKTLSDI